MNVLELIGIWIIVIVLAVPLLWFFVWVFKVFYRAGLEWGDAVKRSSVPVPSPPEIAWALQQEWGRPPTTEEVCAVHRMLHDQRNQALVTAGVGLGALYLLTHHGH